MEKIVPNSGLYFNAWAAKTYGWNLNYGGIALMWRGGCIIRSKFLGKIKKLLIKIQILQIFFWILSLRRVEEEAGEGYLNCIN